MINLHPDATCAQRLRFAALYIRTIVVAYIHSMGRCQLHSPPQDAECLRRDSLGLHL